MIEKNIKIFDDAIENVRLLKDTIFSYPQDIYLLLLPILKLEPFYDFMNCGETYKCRTFKQFRNMYLSPLFDIKDITFNICEYRKNNYSYSVIFKFKILTKEFNNYDSNLIELVLDKKKIDTIYKNNPFFNFANFICKDILKYKNPNKYLKNQIKTILTHVKSFEWVCERLEYDNE